MKARLKAIIPNADFRKNEKTLYNEFVKSRSCPGKLNANECFLFLSKTGNQLLWFFMDVNKISGYKNSSVLIYDSRKWRVDSGTWHPYMLANYASEVGIELVGIKRFEEIYDARRKR